MQKQSMRRKLAVAILCVLVSGLSDSAMHAQRPSPANMLVVHGKTYTVDSNQPWAEAMATPA